LQNYESRFPDVAGFRRVPINVEQPNGLDEFIVELKARRDWFEQEQEQYSNAPWPLGLLARRLGGDTIDVAGSLASQGIRLKVAYGNAPECDAASSAVVENGRIGCVLDLLAFWTAWRLQALDAVADTCGPIHLPQSVMDHLRVRREKLELSLKDGLRSASYESGKPVFQEIAPAVVRDWHDDLERLIHWAEANAAICPVVARDNLLPALREHLARSDIFDSLVLAMQTGVLLVTDDLPTREFGQLVGSSRGAWLHRVFGVALEQGRINEDTFVRWSADLVAAGHNYIGVSGLVLARALRLDAAIGETPGYLFKSLSRVIGGRNAEARSHILAVENCLRNLWSDYWMLPHRQRATGLLLRQVVRQRQDDYVLILQAVLHLCRNLPQLVEYIHSWAQGHFISGRLLEHPGFVAAPSTVEKSC
jgi:cellulose synthase operon protein C